MIGIYEFMPIFNYDELNLISPIKWTDNIKKFRYSIFGGCARNYMLYTEFQCKLSPLLFEAVKLYIPKVYRLPILKNGKKNPYYMHFCDLTYILITMIIVIIQNDQQINFINSSLVHFIPTNYNLYKPIWSSLIIQNICNYIKDNMNIKMRTHIKSLFNDFFQNINQNEENFW